MKTFRSSDGTEWQVKIENPSHSSAVVHFVHPAGRTGRRDRYAWHNATGPRVNDARSRLAPDTVLQALSERDMSRLFRRSMPVNTERAPYIVS